MIDGFISLEEMYLELAVACVELVHDPELTFADGMTSCSDATFLALYRVMERLNVFSDAAIYKQKQNNATD